jgi:hypothetical protein
MIRKLLVAILGLFVALLKPVSSAWGNIRVFYDYHSKLLHEPTSQKFLTI